MMELAFTQMPSVTQTIGMTFCWGMLLSLVGSVPPGMISLTITYSAISESLKAAIFMAIGASLIEILQARISLEMVSIYGQWEGLKMGVQIVAVVVFSILGLFYLRQDVSSPRQRFKSPALASPLLRGIGIGSLNLLAFPYWMFYGTYLQVHGLMDTSNLSQWSMSLGVGLGTFVILCLYAFGGRQLLNRIPRLAKNINRLLALIFGGLACWQALIILFER